MKKSLVVLIASLSCTATFAQGKVLFNTDSLHLVYWGPTAGAYFGQAVNSDNAPPGLPPLSVDLYMGTSSSQLFLYSSTSFATTAAGAGNWISTSTLANGVPATGAPAIPGGTSVFVEVQVRDASGTPPNIFTGNGAAFTAYGTSSLFNIRLGTVAYTVMWEPPNGNWPIGGFNMDSSVYGAGARGAIAVNIIPEPTSAALAGLGATALLIFRRRE
jgi:hypothetical protein